VFKIQNDPRVIPYIGTFLRKTGLDELPQLINILKGKMSLIGPRPPIPAEVERYDDWQRRRLSMKPGLTCIWQTTPRRNDISVYLGMQEKERTIIRWINRFGIEPNENIRVLEIGCGSGSNLLDLIRLGFHPSLYSLFNLFPFLRTHILCLIQKG
jgi:hypothetical protein